MADRGNWYPLINQGIQWSPDGRPYYNTSDGRKDFVPPISAAQYQDDPKMIAWAATQGAKIDYSPVAGGGNPVVSNNSVPGGDFFHNRGTWNSENGGYDTGLNWGNILSLAIAGTITAGVAVAAMGGGAGAQAAVDAALATGSPEAGAAAAGVLPSTALGTGLSTLPSVAASGAVPAALGGGGVAAAAGGELAASAIPQAGMTSLPSAAASGDVAGALGAGEAGVLPSTELPQAGMTSLPNVAPSGAVPAALGAGGSILGTIGKTLGTVNKISDVLGGAGAAVSGATKAAGDTQYQNNLLDLQANNSNITGNNAFENQLEARSKTEASQRERDLANIYMGSYANNRTRSPFNPVAPTPYSAAYLKALKDLENQGGAELSKPAQYGTTQMPALKPYTNFVPNTGQSALQKIGNVAGPALGVAGQLYKLFA